MDRVLNFDIDLAEIVADLSFDFSVGDAVVVWGSGTGKSMFAISKIVMGSDTYQIKQLKSREVKSTEFWIDSEASIPMRWPK